MDRYVDFILFIFIRLYISMYGLHHVIIFECFDHIFYISDSFNFCCMWVLESNNKLNIIKQAILMP